MNKYFMLNRFHFTKLIESIRENDVLPNIVVDNETGIEFYNADTISKEAFISFLQNFNVIDNLAQKVSEQEYKKNMQLGVKNFQFEPSWVKIYPKRL